MQAKNDFIILFLDIQEQAKREKKNNTDTKITTKSQRANEKTAQLQNNWLIIFDAISTQIKIAIAWKKKQQQQCENWFFGTGIYKHAHSHFKSFFLSLSLSSRSFVLKR